MSDPIPVDWSLFEGVNDTRPQRFAGMPFWHLGELLLRHEERTEKDGRAWSPARYRNGAKRGGDGIEAVTALAFDIDHEEPPWELFEGRYAFIAHTGFRHHAEHEDCDGRPDCPHWRVVFALTRELSAEEYNDVWERASQLLYPNADSGSKGAARLLYLPTRQPGRPADTRLGEGRPVNPDLLPPLPPKEPPAPPPVVDGERPGDRFNSETTWKDVIEQHGWKLVYERNGREYWRRPGKDDGISATANGGGYELLYVFSSNAQPFEANRAYSRFAAHALLEHGGDFRAAARELARRYGFSSSPKETREEENPPGAEKRYGAGGGPYFYIRTADPKRVRAPRPLFAHQGISGYIYLGNVAGQTGPGDVGKTTLTLGFIAPRLSRGQLPGIHFEDPVDILIVGDEDDIDEVLTPAFIAGGGDTSRLHFLVYGDEPLVLRRDIKTLRDAAGDYQAKLVYLVQILDHMERDSSYVSMQDVRALLQPFRLLARELDFAGMFAMHPPKGRQTGMARELGGGSGQFTDVPRSGLIVGYHPTEQGRRAFGRGKGNIGRVPPTVSFIIEGGHAVNPATSEVVEVGRIADLREEPNLPAEDLSMRPVKEPEELKKDVIERVMRELGADGDWHTREYAKRACTEAGVGESTFNDRYPRLDFIERRRNGREWRLRDE